MDDYQSIIGDLETSRDTIAADLAATAAALAALPIVANFNEGGDGGSESIDSTGLRAQLMSEIKEKSALIVELNKTIAAMLPGLSSVRVRVTRGRFACR